ncbi:hypothetical protein RHODOSMS8_00967 [Rhodobiaceae bacterium]|nr:hypothetical protein RHODOSMS8_00967 [Rhodobiaceae bacterium]
MSDMVRVSNFSCKQDQEQDMNISGTRFCVLKCSSPEIMLDFGDGWVRVPRRSSVTLPKMVRKIRVKSPTGAPVRGEIMYGDGEVMFSGFEPSVKMDSLVYIHSSVSETVIAPSLNTHGMTLHFGHMRSVSDDPYMYINNPNFVLAHANGGNRFLPAPIEVRPNVGLYLTNNSGQFVTTSVSYELH